ncbi:MAG: type IV pilus secretin PilQ, partial [Thermodesulfobacteriota bacterium]
TAAAGILVILLLSACAEKSEIQDEQFLGKWKSKVEESRPSAPKIRKQKVDLPERKIETQGSPDKAIPAGESKQLPTQTVTLNMRDTQVDAVLRALSRSAGVNIMLTSKVQGKVDVNVNKTPWDQVFDGLLATNGLEYEWRGDIIRVISLDDMKQEQKMEAAKQARIKANQERKETEPLLMRVLKLSYADAESTKPAIKELLTGNTGKDGNKGSRGSVTVDKENNALVIHAIVDDIKKMISLIEELDRPAKQVLIEANIVETTRDVARELGVQWGGLYRSTVNGNNYWLTPGLNSADILGGTIDNRSNPDSGMAANFPAEIGEGGSGMSLGFVTESLDDYILNIQLAALEDAQKLNILSSPSITTLDNQKAIIESGARIPFQTVDEDGDINTEFEDAVLKLEVIPHVIDNQVLKLNILTSKDEVDFSRTVQGNPTIVKKRAETNLILHDGQTTVIGGLSKQTNTDSNRGMPWLKDLPGLGYLFKSISRNRKMEDVLIFITPHIIKEQKPVNKNQE